LRTSLRDFRRRCGISDAVAGLPTSLQAGSAPLGAG
jgi:hypothetical protein